MEEEFYDIDGRNAWNSIYQEIRNESNNFSYIINDAIKLENKNLNRYRNVNPFDHSRVRLRRGDKDYINASLVELPAAGRSYILTQGPLPTTTGHFWLMVWEQNSKAILMLNRVIEKNTVKCHQYWPVGIENGGSDTLLLTEVNLKITFLNETNNAHYSVRNFLLTDLESCNSREVLQFHYTTWPDFGVPESPAAFLSFLLTVHKSDVFDNNFGPPVVHCSAGIGRSGTFCLVDSCLVLIEKNNDLNSINVRQQLLEMRQYRMGLIQTPDQLRFSYLAIIEGAKLVISDNTHHVPLTNENFGKVYHTNSLNEENSTKIIKSIGTTELSLSLPPPHSLQSSCDLSSSKQADFNINCSEQNKELDKCDSCQCLLKHCGLGANTNFGESNELTDKADLKELHTVPLACSASCYTSAESLRTKSFSELRKRARKEREEKVSTIVQNIKKKQKETEIWEKQRSFIKLSFGLVLIIGIGYFVYRNYSKN